MTRTRQLLVPAVALLVAMAMAMPAGAGHVDARHRKMQLLFENDNFGNFTNSDLAFWRRRAYQGHYGGFQIFNIKNPERPRELVDFPCFGPQNDVSVWRNQILVTSVDAVLTGPQCGATSAADPEAPGGWEGLRIFDVSDPRNPRMITDVYQDCGSHTHTMLPDPGNGRLLIYNQSYSLRPGPTCGPNTGPAAGRSPVHGVVQVVEIPLNNPAAAHEIAELPINYPGDPDNQFDPAEHGLDVPGVFFPLRACHDLAFLLEPGLPGTQPGDLGLAAGACAEQAQIFRVRSNGLADTRNPVWIFDDNNDENGATGNPDDPAVAVDFWHSATFTWDGEIVNFSDESFGGGCPTVTEAYFTGPADTGRTFFFDLATGQKLSHFFIPRSGGDDYCSTHQGNVIPDNNNYYLVQAWYQGGADIIDFTNPADPQEIAFWDWNPGGAAGSYNWAHYWYEGPDGPGAVTTYGTDIGRGFQVFAGRIRDQADATLGRLNPQTQEGTLFP